MTNQDLIEKLRQTIVWHELRKRIVLKTPVEDLIRFTRELDQLWPSGKVPREGEVAELIQRNRQLTKLLVSILTYLGLPEKWVSRARKLGVEV